MVFLIDGIKVIELSKQANTFVEARRIGRAMLAYGADKVTIVNTNNTAQQLTVTSDIFEKFKDMSNTAGKFTALLANTA
jgi:hypothetical protein